MDSNLFERIEPLFDIGMMNRAHVLVAGCGSGGSNVAVQLVMSGIRHFTLLDNDSLEPQNVIRHACGRRYLGQRKVSALEDVLRDRNPDIEITRLDVDLSQHEHLDDAIQNATAVVVATDNEPTRHRLNQLCVSAGVPFVVGRVFTRGIGGEVFSYRPKVGGCLACLEAVLQRMKYRKDVSEIDLLSETQRERIYGMEYAEIKDSPGLNVDIAFITAFHTRYCLDAIADTLRERPLYLHPIPENYLVWGNRPEGPFSKNFELQRIQVHPQTACRICGGSK